MATGGKCTGSFAGTVPLLPGYPGGSRQAILRIADDGNGVRYTVGTGPWPDQFVKALSYTCAGQPPLDFFQLLASWWWNTDPEGHTLAPDGKSFSDKYEFDTGLGTVRWTWTFRMQS